MSKNGLVLIEEDRLFEMIAKAVEVAIGGYFKDVPYNSLLDDAKKLYTRDEVAVILKVSANTVSRYIKKKLLHGVKWNGQYRISEKELLRFINQRQK